MTRAYIAGIWGQGPIWGQPWGGWMTSNGVTRTVNRAIKNWGYTGGCFPFNAVLQVDEAIRNAGDNGLRTVLLCYSLGVTFGTWYQTAHKVDRLICIAGSELGRNYPIYRANCKRSVLIRGSGIMSSWGKDAGFNQVEDVPGVPHLLMDFAPQVNAIVFKELQEAVQ